MTFLWSFDFGETTGASLGWYDHDASYNLLDYWEIQHGTRGFIDWWKANPPQSSTHGSEVVAEQFILSPGNSFVADLSGVPAEGALMALWDGKIIWQSRDEKGKKGQMDKILKATGLWQTGKSTNWDDGRDANDTIIHALVSLRNREHLPTLEKYFHA